MRRGESQTTCLVASVRGCREVDTVCNRQTLPVLSYTSIWRGSLEGYDAYDGSGKQTGPTMELFETSREDVEVASDFSEAVPRGGRRGVRVNVR